MKNKPISDIILGSDNVVEHFSKVFPEVCGLTTRGASRYDIRKFFGFFDPLPASPHLDLIYTIKFTQPLFHEPPPNPMWTSYLEAAVVRVTQMYEWRDDRANGGQTATFITTAA